MHRWWGTEQRLLIANFGPEVELAVRDVEAFAPMYERPWKLLCATTDPAFGGSGDEVRMSGVLGERVITVPARSAALFAVAD